MTDWLSPDEWRAVALSLRVSLWAGVVSLPLGILVAYALARGQFWGKQLLNGLVHLPLILPPVVTGYVLLLTFGRRGWLGQWLDEWFGLVFAFRWTGAALAAGVEGARGTGAISARRFWARPFSSALDATGGCGPKAAANTRDAGMPSSISARVTVMAR